jgi:hypothetical protein
MNILKGAVNFCFTLMQDFGDLWRIENSTTRGTEARDTLEMANPLKSGDAKPEVYGV